MREDKFEEQVRRTMEKLGIKPSESVWTNVDREINREKTRKPLFWLFLIPGLLMAGGTYYFTTSKNIPAATAKTTSQAMISKKQDDQPVPKSETPVNEKQLEERDNRQTGNNPSGLSNQKIVNRKSSDRKLHQVYYKKNDRAIPGTDMRETKETDDYSKTAEAGEIVISNYSNKTEQSDKTNKGMVDSAALKAVAVIAAGKSKKDSVANTPAAKNKEQKTKSSPWKIGYTASVGQSNLNQNLFNSVKTLSPVNFATNNPASAGNGSTVNSSSSAINPGFSFAAGAFVSNHISKRVLFSVGINYHYYSTTIKTGMKLNTTLVTNNSLSQQIIADSYYENGNSQTFTNQYHIIEMPLAVDFQLNKSKQKRIIWELGITPGYIVGSNALYYDPNTNVYFSNYLQPNKMQLNSSTALMFGFPLCKGEVQFGPQIQYGLTGFVNTNDGNPGHLFYAGLKISFVPGKK